MRVLLLNLRDNASGLNIIEATHVILMGTPLFSSPSLSPPFPSLYEKCSLSNTMIQNLLKRMMAKQ